LDADGLLANDRPIRKAFLSSQATGFFPGTCFARIVQNSRRLTAGRGRQTKTKPRYREVLPISAHTRSTRRTKPSSPGLRVVRSRTRRGNSRNELSPA